MLLDDGGEEKCLDIAVPGVVVGVAGRGEESTSIMLELVVSFWLAGA